MREDVRRETLGSFSPSAGPGYGADRWDRRADLWQQEQKELRKTDERVEDAVAFLTARGILTPSCRIADIGCGPGRFAAAFARQAHSVVGFDLSEKMVAYGNAHIQSLGLDNARLYCRDFAELDIRQEGCEKAFDLVFASMTRAIDDMAGLQKAMDMSRSWCLHISCIQRENPLRDQLLAEVFQRRPERRGDGRRFEALVQILGQLGYVPETSFFTRRKVTRRLPGEDYAAYLLEHALPSEEHTRENADKIRRWLQAHAEEDGRLTEISNGTYGRVLWDVSGE